MTKKRMIHAINEALFEEMERDEKVILFGEDVGISLFGDTKGLLKNFGPNRVRNTPISETVMTGMAVGAAAAGYRVICHLMFGNFIYTGFDAIANQAAKLRYMTAGQITLATKPLAQPYIPPVDQRDANRKIILAEFFKIVNILVLKHQFYICNVRKS